MRHQTSSAMVRLYGRGNAGRAVVRRMIDRLEGGEMYWDTLRDVFRQIHRVDVGA